MIFILLYTMLYFEMQIPHYLLCHLCHYCYNFFSKVVLQFGNSPRVTDIHLTLEVSQRKQSQVDKLDLAGHWTSPFHKITCARNNRYRTFDFLAVWANAPSCWNHNVRSRPHRPKCVVYLSVAIWRYSYCNAFVNFKELRTDHPKGYQSTPYSHLFHCAEVTVGDFLLPSNKSSAYWHRLTDGSVLVSQMKTID
jgi:hypothetical protein